MSDYETIKEQYAEIQHLSSEVARWRALAEQVRRVGLECFSDAELALQEGLNVAEKDLDRYGTGLSAGIRIGITNTGRLKESFKRASASLLKVTS